jgi:hypothetical protein
LVERLVRNEKVRGSTPLGSTTNRINGLFDIVRADGDSRKTTELVIRDVTVIGILKRLQQCANLTTKLAQRAEIIPLREKFMPKCPCQHCSTNIEFEPEQAGQSVACPSCNLETLLRIPVARVRPPPPPTGAIHAAPTAKIQYLNQIRVNSCYQSLRRMIETFTIAGIVVLVLATVFVWNAVPEKTTVSSAAVNTLLFAVSGVVLFALRQASLVLIDIADTLLHEHSKDSQPKG